MQCEVNIVHNNEVKIPYNYKNSISITILEHKLKHLLQSPIAEL